jgi:hypothetical protein
MGFNEPLLNFSLVFFFLKGFCGHQTIDCIEYDDAYCDDDDDDDEILEIKEN